MHLRTNGRNDKINNNDMPVDQVQHDAGGYLKDCVSIPVANRKGPELRCVRLKIFYQNIAPCSNCEPPHQAQKKTKTECEPECDRMHSGERIEICFLGLSRSFFHYCFVSLNPERQKGSNDLMYVVLVRYRAGGCLTPPMH